jgi:ribosomal protein S18 acetylase RimI-like enzyme
MSGTVYSDCQNDGSGPSISLLDAGGLAGVTDGIVAVYRGAFGGAPYFETDEQVERFAASTLPGHASRRDFRCGVASLPDGTVAGFAYGYSGSPGEWWHENVLARLEPAVLDGWTPGQFELVTLAVGSGHQRRGIGAALHDRLLAGLSHRTALLSTRHDDTPAFRLYTRRGWQILGDPLALSTSADPIVVMGLRL